MVSTPMFFFFCDGCHDQLALSHVQFSDQYSSGPPCTREHKHILRARAWRIAARKLQKCLSQVIVVVKSSVVIDVAQTVGVVLCAPK